MVKPMESIEDAVAEMRRLKSTLPARPSPQEYKYAVQTIARVDNDLNQRKKDLLSQTAPPGIPMHVFRAYHEMRTELMRVKAEEEKRMAVSIRDLAERHQRFEELIAKAEDAATHPLSNNAVQGGSAYDYKQPGSTTPDRLSLPSVSEDLPLERGSSLGRLGTGARSISGSPSFLKPDRVAMSTNGTILSQEASTPGSLPDRDESSARRLADQITQTSHILERARISGQKELSLSNMNLEYVTEDIGNLQLLTSLDLSGNRLKALPESICELTNLTYLNIEYNQLKELTESIGCLTNLRTLRMSHNELEELPSAIGFCTQLVELTVELNKLKVLPLATGNLTSLQRLSIYSNRVQSLPPLHNLTSLVELRVADNCIQRIPDSICHLPKLAKLDASSNYTELRELPRDIGDLQSLRELNISNNQITELPASFRKLTGLEKLEMDGNNWQIPPFDVTRKGKEAVLQFMNDLVLQREINEKEGVKKAGLGAKVSSIFRKKKTPSSQIKVKPVNPLKIRA